MQLFDALAAAHHFGGRHHHLGRVYRNPQEYRQRYRERANVGGFLGSILDSSEFDLLLTFLCFLLACQSLAQWSTAPVTSTVTLVMLYVYFERMIWGPGHDAMLWLHAENYHKYSFHAQRIVQDGQWYRLWTGPFLHKRDAAPARSSRSKLHLYLNGLTLYLLKHVEEISPLPVVGYALFVAAIMAAAGLAYIACLQKGWATQPTRIFRENQQATGGLQAYHTAGMTGVIFALKAYHGVVGALGIYLALYQSSASRHYYSYHYHHQDYMGLAGHFPGLGLPFAVPVYLQHLVELFCVTLLFGQDVPFWANVSGVLAGYVMAILECTAVHLGIISQPWSGAVLVGKNMAQQTAQGHRHRPMEYYPDDEDEEDEEYYHKDPTQSTPTTTPTQPVMGGHPHPKTTTFTPSWMEQVGTYLQANGLVVALLIVAATYVYMQMQAREQQLQRRLQELEQSQGQQQQQQQASAAPQTRAPIASKKPRSSIPQHIQTSIPSQGQDSVSIDHSSWTMANQDNDDNDDEDLYRNDDNDNDDDDDSPSKNGEANGTSMGESLYDDEASGTTALPLAFRMALTTLCTVTETHSEERIIEALQMVLTVVKNAVTKGQAPGEEAQKYRRLRIANPRLQKCNIPGAFDLLLAVGFTVREDFDGEKWLVYPKDVQVPEWMPAALEALQGQLDALKQPATQEQDKSTTNPQEMKRRMRAAALKRQAAASRKKRQPRQSQFSPGLGGGNSKAIYYKGGT